MDKKDEIIFNIEWKARHNGFIPETSIYTNKELKEWCPMLLCEYYEEHLKFPAIKKNKFN